MNKESPDEAAEWYNNQRQSSLRQVDSQLNELASGYSSIENTWRELDEKEELAHDGLDTRSIVAIQTERQRLASEAAQIQEGWNALQAKKRDLETKGEPDFSSVLNSSSEKARLFMRAHRHNLENNPDAMRRLLYADARAKAVGLKPDSSSYFKALEASMGFDSSDRSLDDFTELSEDASAPNTYKVTETKSKSKATPAQRAMARSLPGISEAEYLAAVENPFSQAAQPYDDSEFGQKSMEVNLDETPKQAPVKYKSPDPKTSVNLSPTELSLIENMAAQTRRPVAEVRREFAENKLALHAGQTRFQLTEAKLSGQKRR